LNILVTEPFLKNYYRYSDFLKGKKNTCQVGMARVVCQCHPVPLGCCCPVTGLWWAVPARDAKNCHRTEDTGK